MIVSSTKDQLRCPCPELTALTLDARDGTYACTGADCLYNGRRRFPNIGQAPVLIAFGRVDTVCDEQRYTAGDAPSYVDRRRSRLRQLGSSLGFGKSETTRQNCRAFVEHIKSTSRRPTVLIVGSGTPGSGADRLWQDPDIERVGVDIYPTATVNYVADAHHLPFADASFDGVWIQAVLEHVIDPLAVVAEIVRVLRLGGHVYAETPFMQQVHEGAYDFTRFTITGHRYLFKHFECLGLGPNKGPAISFAWSFKYLIWSLSKSRSIANALSLPVYVLCRLLERFISTEAAWDGAAGVFFFGRKSDTPVPASDIPALYRGLQR